MTEPEPNPPAPATQPKPSRPPLRVLIILGSLLTVVPIVAFVGIYLIISSARFENLIRERLVNEIEQSTGGRVQIATFHWRPLELEADAGGLVIHGLEDQGDEPYAQVENLRIKLSLLSIWSPRVLLRELEITRPGFHFVVYPDGSTNQPQPRKPRKPGKPALDTFFDLRAGHIIVERGFLHYENRSAAFDFQNRYIPLDFDANNLSLRASYLPAGAASAPAGRESYRIEAGATDLSLSRELPRGTKQQAHANMQATVDLMRTGLYLRSFQLTSQEPAAKGHPSKNHTLDISGSLQDFAHPSWQAKVLGDLDMTQVEAIFGYPFTPAGIAHFDLYTTARGADFHTDGSLHIDGGSYIGTGVVATGVQLDAHLHADLKQLVITSIVARLRQGGEMTGELALSPWLPGVATTAGVQKSQMDIVRAHADRNIAPEHPGPYIIPMVGKVTARLENVSLDTMMDMVGVAPFQRLGLNALLNGTAQATWSKGDEQTIVVSSMLNMAPSAQALAGEVPTSGSIDATYIQRNGSVDLRNLELNTPASQFQAHGRLGAYPLTSSSALTFDFHSHDLNEFDAVLREMGMNRNGKSGTAALPVALSGQMDILHATWTGSLIDPHIAASLKATQLSFEMLAGPLSSDAKSASPAQPKFVRFDTVEATGSYAPDRISISHAVLRHGPAEIALEGALNAAPGRVPVFDSNSLLNLHVRAGKVSLDDLLPLAGKNLPLTGLLDAELQLDGAVHALDGSGWVELNRASIYGEPVARLRVQGTMVNSLLKLSSASINGSPGAIAATGSFDLNSRHFAVNAHGAGIDLAKIEALRRQRLPITGKLTFSLEGSGTPSDPRLEGHTTLAALTLGGEPFGALTLAAHTANHSLIYDASTRLESAELKMHGQTTLGGDYPTRTQLEFSHFDIGALLKLTHVQGLSGKSALAGTVTVEGPLAHPDQLRGEARLDQLAVTVAGVPLASQGGVHATLANGLINLDPLHVTGEATDLRAHGSLSLKGSKQVDFTAGGSINLKVAETLDADLTASGTTVFQVEAHGPLSNPGFEGHIEFQNCALSLEDIPNGLSQLNGTLEFSQNRLEVKSLTAMSGGGLLSMAGYLAYQHGIYADLSVNGNGIRIRYPEGVSSLGNATFHLQGTQNNLLLSGNVLITRFSLSPDLDIAALAAQAGNAIQTVAPPDAPSNHIRLDIHVVSSSELNFQNAYAKLAGDVDLHLRGTVASPSLLGRVSITEGSALIAGTRYELQSGKVSFTNPIRIEPNIDLSATARVEDYDITLGLHGTPRRMAVTYRSDPPLSEADVVALLALGRTGSQERLYTQQQEQSVANPTTDALLGGALNASVSSRVQRLFGAGSVKIDPNYIGALGNSTSRITVQEQLGRNVTLTYATDVDTTGQQLLQAEVGLSHHLSLLVARDESGVFSMVIKATRRYR